MKHKKCKDDLHHVRYLTFKYWYCRTCKEEVRADDYLIEPNELPSLGWRWMIKNGMRCWTYADNEWSIIIGDHDAVEIQKMMANGTTYSDALSRAFFPSG